MRRDEEPLVVEARVLLHADAPPPDLDTALRVSKQLKQRQDFGLARRVLNRAREHPSLTSERNRPKVRRLVQQHALCHSKDTSLPYRRHEEALGFLEDGADLKSTTDKETLGIAGGILKRMWARSGQSRYLTQGLNCYERGYFSPDDQDDYGYNGINAAFLNDQLATEDDPRTALERCRNAQEIREALIGRLPTLRAQHTWLGSEWWYLVTVAEALLGLHRYSEASEWLRQAQETKVDDWEKQATATQLIELCRLHARLGGNLPTLIVSVPASTESVAPTRFSTGLEVVRSAFPNVPITDLGLKMGLALSGGGFRASFYHLGVLARLADEDQLRRVEVLSCVSGGSILGAHYYLEVRALLERKADADVVKEDYIDVVGRVADRFLTGVQRNLRTRVLASPQTSLSVLFGDQTRTKYLGELFERELYARVADNHPKDQPRWLNDLLVHPLGEPERFHPRNHNWRRRAKVPVLILNATTLNTGHLWQFTATWMGEPPAPINPLIDLRERLRRLYYGDAPEGFQRMRLGHAVAASACVPALFHPLAVSNLYEGVRVELVDGGVHDNQGIEGLTDLDREHHACTHVIISDASGQMPDLDKPSGRIPKLLPRLISVEGDVQREQRVLRTVEAGHAADAATPGEPAGRVAFMHLQTGLDAVAISPAGVPDGDAERERMSPAHTGVPPRAQRLLARVRTDLDAFSEVEALSLMLDGYRLAGSTIAMEPGIAALAGDGVPGRPDVGWRFEDVAADLDALPEPYLRRLRIAEQRFLKPLRLVLAGLTKRRKQTMSESAHRLTRRRWTVRAAGIAWLAVLGGLVFAGVVLADSDVSAAALYASLVGLMAGLFLYASPDTPGLHYVSRLLFSVLAPLVAWPFLPLLAGLQLLGGWLHLRAGRVPERKAARRERAPEARRAAVER